MHDRARLVLLQELPDEAPIADVALDEDVALVVAQRLEVAQAAGVSELVEVHHRLAGRGDGGLHEIRADEAGAAGDEEHSEKRILRPKLIIARDADCSGNSLRRLGHAALAAVAIASAQAVLAARLRAHDAAGDRGAAAQSGGRAAADRDRQRRAPLPGCRAAARDRVDRKSTRL